MHKITVNQNDTFEVTREGNSIVLDGKPIALSDVSFDKKNIRLTYDRVPYAIEVLALDLGTKKVILKINDHIFETVAKNRLDTLIEQSILHRQDSNMADELKAPMPGSVIEVVVTVGSQVKKGDKLLVLEAMKMENVLKAPSDARVKSVLITKGTSVQKDQLLLVFESS